MDDDLSSLRGGGSPSEDDFFSSFDSPASSDATLASNATPAGPVGGSGSLDLGLDGFDQPAAAPAPAPAQKGKKAAPPKKKAASRPSKRSAGMTPQQRMVLSIFLFLDVAILGCLILFAVGSINLP